MKHTIHRLLLGLSVVFIMAGCSDIGNANWDVDVLAPVLKTRLDMGDLVADSLLEADMNGALRLKIETSLIDFPLDSILKIPDTSIVKGVSLPVALNNVEPGTELPPLTDATRYDLGDLALKKVVLRSGKLRLKVSSIVQTEIDLKYIIPGASKFGSVFETTQTMPAGSATNPSTKEFEFDLAGYTIDLRGADGTSFNTLTTTFIIKTSVNGSVISIPAQQEFFSLEYGFVGILPSYGTGYFGQQSSSVDDVASDIDILSNITDGQMFLDSVKIGIKLKNGVGADARFRLSQLSSLNSRTNTSVNLNHSLVGTDVLLSRAQDLTGNAEDVIGSEAFYYLDNGNSNVKQFIENLPDQLGFLFDFDINPLGNVSSGNDFFYYDRPFEALMNIDIPLRATLTNLTLVDTIEWNLSENAVVESVNSGSFTLVANNGFPLEGMIELVLLDENNGLLDTLIVPSTIAAPALNAQNRVIAPRETRILIPVPSKTSNVLARTKFVRFRVRFNTANQPDLIQFYQDNAIDIKLIGNFNINFGTSTL